ncbi:MAG TPA: hypothetical protein VGL72_29720 [Bryobacteraceae bacterium]
MTTRMLAVFLAVSIASVAQEEAIHVVVLEGDGAINNVRASHAKEPLVRVEDANNRGVPGAIVTFVVPSGGPGVLFGDAGTTLTLTTDDRGEVVVRAVRPNRNAGSFQIHVTASKDGKKATALIAQTNVDPGSHTSSRKIAILALIGGAAAAGAAVALHGGKSSSAASSAPGTVVTAGSPTLGGPQ